MYRCFTFYALLFPSYFYAAIILSESISAHAYIAHEQGVLFPQGLTLYCGHIILGQQSMKLATFNLFQFAAPGFYWHDRNTHNTYTESEWVQKTTWITTRLHQMGADVVGFQEVFSIDSLKALCQTAGYPFFITVDTSGLRHDDAQVFNKSVVALASRFPIVSTHIIDNPAEIASDLPIPSDFGFSRIPICVDIQTPEFGRMTLYVVHLKSKRPVSHDMHYDNAVPWSIRVPDTLRRLSRGTIASLLQRGIEATVLYHHINTRLLQEPKCPVVVLGDMNDDIGAMPLTALTMQDKVQSIGGVYQEQWPLETIDYLHAYRLQDTFRLAPSMRHRVRSFTIIHRGDGEVLDYILVSNHLNPKNAATLAEISQYEVWNQHLDQDGVENRLQSDHGQVCIELTPCQLPPDYLATLSHNTRTIKTQADIRTRQDFVQYAGCLLQSPKHFKQWSSIDKWTHFWSFFFDSEFGWVTSIYGSTPVSELYQKQRHSIEHVIPLEFLDRYLAHKKVPRHVRNGATINPFNFLPSERGLNAKRSNFPFDLENDQVIRPPHLQLYPDSFDDQSGFDADHEWVVPSRNRGDVARAILYMLLMYEIDELYNQHLETLIHWAKIDPPSSWEIAYNQWVYTRQAIRNPFIDQPEKILSLINNRDLLKALEFRA